MYALKSVATYVHVRRQTLMGKDGIGKGVGAHVGTLIRSLWRAQSTYVFRMYVRTGMNRGNLVSLAGTSNHT